MRTYSLITFGCQMNSHDSERMAEILEGAGYSEAPAADQADLIFLNTCSVREKAEHKLRSEVGRLAMLKASRPNVLLGVAGCVAQQEGERILKRMPSVDLVVGPDNIREIPGMLLDLELGAPPQVRTTFDLTAPIFLSARRRSATAAVSAGPRAPTAFVTVMKGCNERCSFCIVPTTRGPERYRPAREILAEVAELVDSGVREITLLGQTVNSYLDPERSLAPARGAGDSRWKKTRGALALEDESEFPALLRAIALCAPSLKRLRYTSPHPRHLTLSLIYAHQDLPVLARHIHLPVQSGSDHVLKRMLRRYSVAEYEERLEALRESIPELDCSTDIIVGFPGETEEDFVATLELVERVGYLSVYGFKYSERPGTPALNFVDDVEEAEKRRRLERLFILSEGWRQRHLTARVGMTRHVLCEALGRVQEGATAAYTGRTEQNEIVHFHSQANPIGEVIPIQITQAYKHSLYGVVPETAVAAGAGAASPQLAFGAAWDVSSDQFGTA